MVFGNTPSQRTDMHLERGKSFAFDVLFEVEDHGPVDITGDTVRFVVQEPDHLGGEDIILKDAQIVDGPGGLARFELQATDTELDPASYAYDITHVDSSGYSIPVAKGRLVIGSNTDDDTTNVYADVDPSTEMRVLYGNGSVLKVCIERTEFIEGPVGPQGLPSALFIQAEQPTPDQVPTFGPLWVDTDDHAAVKDEVVIQDELPSGGQEIWIDWNDESGGPGGGGGGGGGGVTDHGALTGLSDPDHPIDAVQGLQAALDGKAAFAHTHGSYADATGVTVGWIPQSNGSNGWTYAALPTFPPTTGHNIQDEGVAITDRSILNFVGAGVTVTDSAGTGKTVVNIPGGSGGFPSGTGRVYALPANFTATIDPTGVADSTAGLQEFLNSIPVNGVGIIPPGTYKLGNYGSLGTASFAGTPLTIPNSMTIDATGATFNVDHRADAVKFSPAYDTTYSVSSMAQRTGTYGHEGEPLKYMRFTLTTTADPGYLRGDIIKVFSDDILGTFMDNANVRSAASYTVLGTTPGGSGTTVDLAGLPRWPTTSNIRMAKFSENKFTWIGGTFRHSDSILNEDPARNCSSAILVEGCKYPVIRDVRVRFWGGPPFGTRRSYAARVLDCYIDYAQDESARFGYGVIDSGEFTLVSGLVANRVRHAYDTGSGTPLTAGSTKINDYGIAYGGLVRDSVCHGATQTAWSTHGGSKNINFVNCAAYNCYAGFTLRGIEHSIIGGIVKDATWTGVSVPTSSSAKYVYGSFIGGGLILDNCDGYPIMVEHDNGVQTETPTGKETRPTFVNGVVIRNRASNSLIHAIAAVVRMANVFCSDGFTTTTRGGSTPGNVWSVKPATVSDVEP